IVARSVPLWKRSARPAEKVRSPIPLGAVLPHGPALPIRRRWTSGSRTAGVVVFGCLWAAICSAIGRVLLGTLDGNTGNSCSPTGLIASLTGGVEGGVDEIDHFGRFSLPNPRNNSGRDLLCYRAGVV